MLACTGHVTQGKLGTNSAVSPLAASCRNLGIAATSSCRRLGTDNRTIVRGMLMGLKILGGLESY
jgi:hypothetical protein